MPTDQRTCQREKGLVDVGSFIVTDAGTAELISAMRTSVRRPTGTVPSRCRVPCDASPAVAECHEFEPVSDSRRIVAAVAHHTIWPIPWPSTFTLEWRNRIDQRQSFVRVIAVGTGQPDSERHTSRAANQMTLAPLLGAIRGFGPVCVTTCTPREPSSAVNNRSGPIDVAFAGEPVQEREVRQIPDSFRLPVAGVASMSCQNHSAVLEATSATVFRCAARTGYRSGRRDQAHAAVRRSTAMVEEAEAVR